MITEEEKKKLDDYNAPIMKASTEIARIIVEQMLESFDLFMDGYDEKTPEETEELRIKRVNFAINLIGMMAGTDIPADYASFPIQKVSLALDVIKDTIDSVLKSWTTETMSRIIGAKSPMDGGYNREWATLKEYMNAVMKIRSETGGEETYNVPKKVEEAPSEEIKKPEAGE